MKLGCLTALVVVAGIIGFGWLAYRSSFPTYTYRYRMIVNVETPDGLRSASSVIQVSWRKQPQLLVPVPPYHPSAEGEAVFVDLGNGRNLIALLAGGVNGADVDYVIHAPQHASGLDFSEASKPRLPYLTGRWTLPEGKLPTFVTFTDLNDPLSARVMPPDQFESVFGPGIRLRDVTIEMTKDDVTRGIEGKLPVMMGKLRELDKTLQVEYPNAPLRVRSGHLSIK